MSLPAPKQSDSNLGLKLFEELIENCAEQLRSDLIPWLAGAAYSPRETTSTFPCYAEWDDKAKGLLIEITTRPEEALNGLTAAVEYDRYYMLPENFLLNKVKKGEISAAFEQVASQDPNRRIWRAVLRLPKNAKITQFYTSGI